MDPLIIQALVKAIELKDASTAAHTWRVVLYTRALAEEAGVDHAMIERLTFAAALHDMGKIDIPDGVLTKPGPLTDPERAVMRTHADLGHARLVRMGEGDPVMLELVRHHHERPDGRGYPDALSGASIPAWARFFSVVDSFDAMTSLRPYRADVGPAAAERAIDELRSGSGTAYWPEAVAEFTRLYRSGRLGWVLEYFNDRCEPPEFDAAAVARVARSAAPARVIVPSVLPRSAAPTGE
ncbi:MAG: HD-GYP domain-containing protein [Phycisphaerales bacterium]